MTERMQALIFEAVVATTLTVLTMSPEERVLMGAKALQLSAKVSRHMAEACLRYAMRAENRAIDMVSP